MNRLYWILYVRLPVVVVDALCSMFLVLKTNYMYFMVFFVCVFRNTQIRPLFCASDVNLSIKSCLKFTVFTFRKKYMKLKEGMAMLKHDSFRYVHITEFSRSSMQTAKLVISVYISICSCRKPVFVFVKLLYPW